MEETQFDMQLLQILLPFYDSESQSQPEPVHEQVKDELMQKFGGLTFCIRCPEDGKWRDARNGDRDRIIIYEVMTATFDDVWWDAYRQELEARFQPEEIIIRVLPMGVI
jgi:hypothetical protein